MIMRRYLKLMLGFASFLIGHLVLLRRQVGIYLHVCMNVCARTGVLIIP